MTSAAYPCGQEKQVLKVLFCCRGDSRGSFCPPRFHSSLLGRPCAFYLCSVYVPTTRPRSNVRPACDKKQTRDREVVFVVTAATLRQVPPSTNGKRLDAPSPLRRGPDSSSAPICCHLSTILQQALVLPQPHYSSTFFVILRRSSLSLRPVSHSSSSCRLIRTTSSLKASLQLAILASMSLNFPRQKEDPSVSPGSGRQTVCHAHTYPHGDVHMSFGIVQGRRRRHVVSEQKFALSITLPGV